MSKPRQFVLLGAGASKDAGVPTVREMSQRIIDHLSDGSGFERDAGPVLKFVAGGLVFQSGVRGEDLFSGVDVEELFSAVELLAERRTLEAAPFVATWHPLVEALDHEPVSSLSLQRDLERAVKKLAWKDDPFAGRDLLEALQKVVQATSPSASDGSAYRRVAEQMIRALRHLVEIPDIDALSYLDPLFRAAGGQLTMGVATLNYDASIELRGEALSQPVATGIDSWSRDGSVSFPHAGIHLLKLHGSIDWVLERERYGSEERPLPYSRVRLATEEEQGRRGWRPAVVFGQRGKLRSEGPFLDLLRAFRDELRSCQIVSIVGYSFRDEHINAELTTWLNESPDRVIRVLDPAFGDTRVPFVGDLQRLPEHRLHVDKRTAREGLSEFLRT